MQRGKGKERSHGPRLRHLLIGLSQALQLDDDDLEQGLDMNPDGVAQKARLVYC